MVFIVSARRGANALQYSGTLDRAACRPCPWKWRRARGRAIGSSIIVLRGTYCSLRNLLQPSSRGLQFRASRSCARVPRPPTTSAHFNPDVYYLLSMLNRFRWRQALVGPPHQSLACRRLRLQVRSRPECEVKACANLPSSTAGCICCLIRRSPS